MVKTVITIFCDIYVFIPIYHISIDLETMRKDFVYKFLGCAIEQNIYGYGIEIHHADFWM